MFVVLFLALSALLEPVLLMSDAACAAFDSMVGEVGCVVGTTFVGLVFVVVVVVVVGAVTFEAASVVFV